VAKKRKKGAKKRNKQRFWLRITIILIFFVSIFLIFKYQPWKNLLHYKPINNYPTRYSAQAYPIWGLDMSHHNGEVDWDRISATKPNFVFIKATEGVTLKDKKYIENWESLKKHKIIRGAYHFFSYSTDGKLQALNYISQVKLINYDLPPVLDAEYIAKMPKAEKVTKEIKKWLTEIEKHYKVKPIIYCPLTFYKQYLDGKIADYPLWICDYIDLPDENWTFWQHTDKFIVSEIEGTFDRNVFNGNKEKFGNLLINNVLDTLAIKK